MSTSRSRTLGKPRLNRDINKAQVLDILRRRHTVSRADLVRITGIQANTISYIVSELVDQGLARVVGPGVSTGGRQPMLLECVPEGMHAVGLEIEQDRLVGVIVDFEGRAVAEAEMPLHQCEPEKVAAAALHMVSDFQDDANDKDWTISGIGIALPGIVSAREQSVWYSGPLHWQNIDLGSMIHASSSLPVRLMNNAMGCAVSHYDQDPYHSQSSFLNYLVFLDNTDIESGAGIGCGIILNGRPYVGKDHSAGELATRVEHPLALAQEHTEGSFRNFQDLLEASKASPERYADVWEGFNRALGAEVARGITYLNPHHVIISSDCPELESLIGKNLAHHVHEFTVAGRVQAMVPKSDPVLPAIDFHPLDKNTIARGAALPFILDSTLPPQLETGALL